ncbi:MAG TPA: hypothetical protein VFS21_40300 [Roseiflexaceae bacterium]|nr:hypothetical protein [Roseiflexaceae bacterium]
MQGRGVEYPAGVLGSDPFGEDEISLDSADPAYPLVRQLVKLTEPVNGRFLRADTYARAYLAPADYVEVIGQLKAARGQLLPGAGRRSLVDALRALVGGGGRSSGGSGLLDMIAGRRK